MNVPSVVPPRCEAGGLGSNHSVSRHGITSTDTSIAPAVPNFAVLKTPNVTPRAMLEQLSVSPHLVDVVIVKCSKLVTCSNVIAIEDLQEVKVICVKGGHDKAGPKQYYYLYADDHRITRLEYNFFCFSTPHYIGSSEETEEGTQTKH